MIQPTASAVRRHDDLARLVRRELEVRRRLALASRAEGAPQRFGRREAEKRNADDQRKELRLPRPVERAEIAPAGEQP